MDMTEVRQDGFVTLALSGELDARTAPDLENKVNALVGANEARLLFDCSQLEYISSAGLRSFLIAAKKVKRANGKLGVVGIQDLVLDVFKMAGFADMFSFYPSQAEAVQGLQ